MAHCKKCGCTLTRDEMENNIDFPHNYCMDCYCSEKEKIINLWKKEKPIIFISKNSGYNIEIIFKIIYKYFFLNFIESPSENKIKLLHEFIRLKLCVLENDEELVRRYKKICSSPDAGYYSYIGFLKFLSELEKIPTITKIEKILRFFKKSLKKIEKITVLNENKDKKLTISEISNKCNIKLKKFRICDVCQNKIDKSSFLDYEINNKDKRGIEKGFCYIREWNNKKLNFICHSCKSEKNLKFINKYECSFCKQEINRCELVICKNCGVELCFSCSLICKNCLKELCPNCIKRCNICKEYYCAECVKSHLKDEREFQTIKIEIRRDSFRNKIKESEIPEDLKSHILEKFKNSDFID